MEITQAVALKVLEVVDVGLVSGMGKPIPGAMCVEAAVCYALGLPHGDDPQCVSPVLRQFKIRLNDGPWSSNEARAAGLRRLAVAQLGSVGVLDDKEFSRRVTELAVRKAVPIALRAAASTQKDEKHKAALLAAANKCEKDGTRESVQEAYAVADAADADADGGAAAAVAYASVAAADAAAVAYASVAAYTSVDAYAAAAYAASASGDKILAEFAEDVVEVLVSMGAPGCQWLVLTEAA